MIAMKDFMTQLGSSNYYLDRHYWMGKNEFPSLDRSSYIFNSSLIGVGKTDQILLIGTNPKKKLRC